MAVAVTFVGRATYTSLSNPRTETAVALGSAATDRIIVFTLYGQTSDTEVPLTSISIGGISATRIIDKSAAANQVAVSTWWALVPTGTTGDIIITYPAAPPAGRTRSYTIHKLVGCNTTTPVPGTNSTATQVWNAEIAAKALTVDIPSGGAVITAAIGILSMGSLVWSTSGATEDDDVANTGSAATFTTGSTQNTYSVTLTPSSTAIAAASASVFQPPGIITSNTAMLAVFN